MILIGATQQILLSLALVGGAPPQQPIADAATVSAARRVAATAQLAAQEYRNGVTNGQVTASAEVSEAKLFLGEANRSASLLPGDEARRVTAGLDSISQMVSRTASPDSIAVRVDELARAMSQRLGITLADIPANLPSLARGAQIYRQQCSQCHGASGRGDGLAAANLSPKPADLTDAQQLLGTSPLDYYRRITIGVAGTAMPAFESTLSSEDRWAAAAYTTLLRLPRARGDVPPGLRSFATTAAMSDSAVLGALGDSTGRNGPAQLAAVRSYDGPTAAAVGPVFTNVDSQLDSAAALAHVGQYEAASSVAFDAYMTFEQVEPSVRALDPGLANRLEAAFADYRTRAAGGATASELSTIRARLAADLENAERTIGDRPSPLGLFVQSFILLLREGMEALLIVGALLTFLSKIGASQRRRDIHIGVVAAIGASIVTAVLLETLFEVAPARREALEGGTMVVAVLVLFYVSYWLLSKMEVAKWSQFVKSRVHDAVTSGSALALASAAFLAVYREGFETVLFYKALFVSAGPGAAVMPVAGGIALGALVLVIVYFAINRFGVRLPLKPFFGFTSAFLYYMAFVFAGKGIAELQEGQIVSTTIIPWAPRIPALGIYPTVESLSLQAVLLLLAVAALVWTFLIAPRRSLPVTQVMVPEPAGRPAAPVADTPDSRQAEQLTVAAAAAAAGGTNRDLIRSLERMEADLAELRAEVERMRRALGAGKREGGRAGGR